MKIAYLVFAYNNPRLLEREIQALSSPDSTFFIHIDKKSNLDDFARIKGENINYIEDRVTVYWAEFSGVRAILKLIRQALRAEQQYDYCVLLSGSEYPLRSRQYIEEFFQANRGTEFIDLVKLPNLEAGRPASHINTFRFESSRPFLRWVVRILSRMGLVRRDYRKHLDGLDAYGGHTWWALTRDACQHIVNFVGQNQKIVKFFENTAQPEEFFFHTILGNSKFLRRTRRSLVFEDWSAAGRRPDMINDRHVDYFEGQDKVMMTDVWGSGEVLFARKYSDANLALIDRIESKISNEQLKLRS